MHAASLQSILDNYKVLLEVWNDSLSSRLDGEMRARIIGVNTQMYTYDFLFGISLGNLLLRHTDNLSKSLQKKSLSAAEGQRLAYLTLDVLNSLHDEDNSSNSMHVFSKTKSILKLMILLYQGSEEQPMKLEMHYTCWIERRWYISEPEPAFFFGTAIMWCC